MPFIATVPTYGGDAIFGPAASVRGRITEPARSTRGFVGVNGLLTKRNGTRGATAEAVGTLFADNPLLLRQAEAVFQLYLEDGNPRDLVDTCGRTWPQMILVSFEPAGPPYQDQNGWSREYHAVFLGLALPTSA